MATNKVILNGEVKIDLTKDTVTENTVITGKKFHKANGEEGIGKAYGIIYDDENNRIYSYLPDNKTSIKMPLLPGGYYYDPIYMYFPDTIITDWDMDYGSMSEYWGDSLAYGYNYCHLFTNNINNAAASIINCEKDCNSKGENYCPKFIFKNKKTGKPIFKYDFSESVTHIPYNFFFQEFIEGGYYWRSEGMNLTQEEAYEECNESGLYVHIPDTLTDIYSYYLASSPGYYFPVTLDFEGTTPPNLNYIQNSPYLGNVTFLIPAGAKNNYINATNFSSCSPRLFLEKDTGYDFQLYNGNTKETKTYHLDRPMTWREWIEANPNEGFKIYDMSNGGDSWYHSDDCAADIVEWQNSDNYIRIADEALGESEYSASPIFAPSYILPIKYCI